LRLRLGIDKNWGSDTVLKIKFRRAEIGPEWLSNAHVAVDQMDQLSHRRTDHRLGRMAGCEQPFAKGL
jgi:hypothetical protein